MTFYRLLFMQGYVCNTQTVKLLVSGGGEPLEGMEL